MSVGERSPEEDQAQLAVAYASTDLRIEELWLAYFSLGGNADHHDVEEYLAGRMPFSAHEHNVLAQAVNEQLIEQPSPPRVPYRDPDQ